MESCQLQVVNQIPSETPSIGITLKNVVKVARKVLSDEDNFKFHQMLTVWEEKELLTKSISFVSKRKKLTVEDWIRLILE